MVNAVHYRHKASDRSYFAILKKEVHALALSHFKANRLAEIDIVVAEMVSNLAKHAQSGEILVKLIEEKGIQGIEIISIDSGPGIPDLKGMMLDGVSTKKTLGQGLGAMNRLSDLFQVYTLKGWGTIVLCRIFNQQIRFPNKAENLQIRSLLAAKPGEKECGDGFYFKQTRDHLKVFLGDGLGHGKEAELAVNKAIEAFKQCADHSPVENLRFINSSVKRTRGLVATIAILNIKERLWKICGLGNVSTRVIGPSNQKIHSSYNGILGLNMPNTMKDQEVRYETGQCIVMCSDGIKTKWDISRFPGIMRYDGTILNAALFKDFARNTDDMSIASCKMNI